MHPQLRSTRPRHHVLALTFTGSLRLWQRHSADVHIVDSHPQSETNFVEELTSSLFALPRSLSNGKWNTHSPKMGGSFRCGLTWDLSYAVLPSLPSSNSMTIMISHGNQHIIGLQLLAVRMFKRQLASSDHASNCLNKSTIDGS